MLQLLPLPPFPHDSSPFTSTPQASQSHRIRSAMLLPPPFLNFHAPSRDTATSLHFVGPTVGTPHGFEAERGYTSCTFRHRKRSSACRWPTVLGIGVTVFAGWPDIVKQALFSWADDPKPGSAGRPVHPPPPCRSRGLTGGGGAIGPPDGHQVRRIVTLDDIVRRTDRVFPLKARNWAWADFLADARTASNDYARLSPPSGRSPTHTCAVLRANGPNMLHSHPSRNLQERGKDRGNKSQKNA